MPKRIDMTGKVYGRLTCVSLSHSKKQHSYWVCKCECGNTHIATMDNLRRGMILSCGCLQKENGSKIGKRTRNNNAKKLNYVEGTLVEMINNNTLSKASTTGVRGVTRNKRNGNYIAQIKFKYKNHYLGSFTDIESATKARKEAEENLFSNFLESYNNECKNEGSVCCEN